jgi:hypothetical protein
MTSTAAFRQQMAEKRRQHTREGLCRACSRPTAVGGFCKKHWLSAESYKVWGTAKYAGFLAGLWRRQRGRCGLTGKKLSLETASLDHKHPVKRFPERRGWFDNLQWVDRTANKSKGCKTVSEYLAEVSL